MTDSNAKRIAELNDLCRKAMGIAGRLMQMEGFNTLPLHIQFAMRERVETFDNFTSDNDPYVGVVEHKENRTLLVCSKSLPRWRRAAPRP